MQVRDKHFWGWRTFGQLVRGRVRRSLTTSLFDLADCDARHKNAASKTANLSAVRGQRLCLHRPYVGPPASHIVRGTFSTRLDRHDNCSTPAIRSRPKDPTRRDGLRPIKIAAFALSCEGCAARNLRFVRSFSGLATVCTLLCRPDGRRVGKNERGLRRPASCELPLISLDQSRQRQVTKPSHQAAMIANDPEDLRSC
jgi:hypothetical protein